MDTLIYECFGYLDCELVLSTLLFVKVYTYTVEKAKTSFRRKFSGQSFRSTDKFTPQAGLQNLGNTCYFNSVLQCLLMCKEFRDGVNKDKSWADQSCLYGQLRDVFRKLTEQKDKVCPQQFLNSSRPPWFSPGYQQDSSELLRYMLELLHEEDKCKSPKEAVVKDSGGTLYKLWHLLPWKLDSVKDETKLTLVEKLFVGEMQNMVTCVTCKSEYATKQNFYDITLHFPAGVKTGGNVGQQIETQTESVRNNTCVRLHDLFEEYFKAERMTGDGQFYCKSCDTLQDADKTVTITKFPQVLVLSIARFDFDFETQSKIKLQNSMIYPKVLILNHNEDIEEHQKPTEHINVYGLTGVVVHVGATVNHGHYFCFGRQGLSGTAQENNAADVFEDDWYKFDDAHVSHIGDFSKVKAPSSDSAYILFYTRVKQT